MSQSIIPIISHLLPHGVLNILTNYNPALTILVLIVLTITTTTLVSILYQAHFSPLSKIPGPFLAKYSRLWLAYHGFKGDFHTLLVELHETYGDLVRIGPDELSVADVEAVRKIYGIVSSIPIQSLCTVYVLYSVLSTLSNLLYPSPPPVVTKCMISPQKTCR